MSAGSSDPLYLTARVEGSRNAASGANALSSIYRVDEQLRASGWKRPVADGFEDVGFFEDLAAYALVDSQDEARSAIAQLMRFLSANDAQISASVIRLQAWIVCERMDRPVPSLAARWTRQEERDLRAHPHVIPFPYWRIS